MDDVISMWKHDQEMVFSDISLYSILCCKIVGQLIIIIQKIFCSPLFITKSDPKPIHSPPLRTAVRYKLYEKNIY